MSNWLATSGKSHPTQGSLAQAVSRREAARCRVFHITQPQGGDRRCHRFILSPTFLLPMSTSTTICDFPGDSRSPASLIPPVIHPWFPNACPGPLAPPQPLMHQNTNQLSTDHRPRKRGNDEYTSAFIQGIKGRTAATYSSGNAWSQSRWKQHR